MSHPHPHRSTFPPGAAPIDAASFAAAMAAFAPFEPSPVLAVAVSGGPDSMALALLADRWARDRGGRILAITIDHGLRQDSAGEALQVGEWLTGRGIGHCVRGWCQPSGRSNGGAGLQAAARQARYALLEQVCRDEGILHLLLAHTRTDQAETLLLRLSRGSGPDGLAGMAACRGTGRVRMLRPLLAEPKARLEATCAAFVQSWLCDPTNDTPRFARGRLRAVSAHLASEGLSEDGLALTAARAAGLRAHLDAEVAAFLAGAATILPEGYVRLDVDRLRDAEPEIASRALARCLMAVGGGRYPPRHGQLEHLLGRMRSGEPLPGATLGGCQIVARAVARPPDKPVRHWIISREPAGARERLSLTPGQTLWWDRRFVIGPIKGPPGPRLCTVRRLSAEGAALLAGTAVPARVRAGLPGLWENDRLVALPTTNAQPKVKRSQRLPFFRIVFQPATLLAGPPFTGSR